jgi:hypothetical protein
MSEFERLRTLLDDGVSLEGAWSEITAEARQRRGGAPQATVEALVYGLSIRNTAALREPEVQRRLAQLSDEQLYEVGDRLQRLDPKVMRLRAPTARPWMRDEIQELLEVRSPTKPGAVSGDARQTRGRDAEEPDG